MRETLQVWGLCPHTALNTLGNTVCLKADLLSSDLVSLVKPQVISRDEEGSGNTIPQWGNILRETSPLSPLAEGRGKLEGWRQKGETKVHGGEPCGVKETGIWSGRIEETSEPT